MKNLLLSLLVIGSMIFLMACPKESAVRRAAKASYSLSGLTIDAANATAKAYNAGLITFQTKDKIANALKTMAVGGKYFNQTLEKFISESGAELPADKIAMLNKIFSDEVVTPFFEILQSLKFLSADKADYLRSAINALRSTVLAISSGFASLKAKSNFGEVNIYV